MFDPRGLWTYPLIVGNGFISEAANPTGDLPTFLSTMHLQSTYAARLMVALLVSVAACEHPTSVERVTVSLAAGELYLYPTVGGDEEGATIVTQARHFAISEIRRNSTTNWIATYAYQPAAGFKGLDDVEIEIHTGSDGASPSTKIHRVAIHFEVR